MQSRFPSATAVYVVGSLTTNYWNEDSDLDLLVAIPKSDSMKFSEELPIINGRELLTRYSPIPGELDQKTPIKYNHPVYWYLVNNSVSPHILADKFGRIFEIKSRTWYGSLLPGKSQLGNPKSLLRYINWQLFKYKEALELYPLAWTEVFAGFDLLSNREKLEVIDGLKWRASRLERMTRSRLTQQPAEVWKALEQFESKLEETKDEELAPTILAQGIIPRSILSLALHHWRYKDLASRLQVMADDAADSKQKSERMQGLPVNAKAGLPAYKKGLVMESQPVVYYSVALVHGPTKQVAKAKKWLKERKVKLLPTGPSTLGLPRLRASGMKTLTKIASSFGLSAVELRDPYTREEIVSSGPRPKLKRMANRLSLQPKKWYYAEQLEDRYPFVFVRSEFDQDGSQIWDVDLLSPQNSLPRRTTVSAETLASFGLRPATSKDFDEFDLPTPFAQYLTKAELFYPNLRNIKAFKVAGKNPPEISSEAKIDFLELTQTYLTDWKPNEAGALEALVQDEDTVGYVNNLVSEWAKEHKFPSQEVDASGDTKKWTYTTPGTTSIKPVVVVEATKQADGDDRAIGPWKVSITQLWSV